MDERIDAWMLRIYYAARPFVEQRLSEVDDKQLKEMFSKRGKGGRVNPLRVQLMREMLDAYTPQILKRRMVDPELINAKVIPNMSQEAALGIMEAFDRGYFKGELGERAWLSVAKRWFDIKLTAQKGT